MSDDNKFFRFVWRFNGIVLMLLCLSAIVVMGYNLTSGFFAQNADRPEGHFAPVSSAAEADNTYRLKPSGTIGFLKNGGGQDVSLVFTLGDWEGSPDVYGLAQNSSSSSRAPYDANLLLVSTETGAGRWLFAGFARNIVGWDVVVDPQAKDTHVVASAGPQVIGSRSYGDYQSARALVLKVVDKDTNGDRRLSNGDRLTLYVYRGGSAEVFKLLEADLVLQQTQVGGDRYAITYESGGTAWIAVYSIPDFQPLTKKALPKLPN